jgi:hypothetical protein
MAAFTPEELAWAAGLFEGEGTIRINKPGKRSLGILVCSVVNTDLSVVEFFQARWQGYMKSATGLRSDERPAWVWVVGAKKAESFLETILPYIHTERVWTKAQVAFAFQELKSLPPSQRPLDYTEQSWRFYRGMKAMNVRGVHPPESIE